MLEDLRARILATRWPEPAPGPAWSQGSDLDELRATLAYWAEGFDWRSQERALNAFPQSLVTIDDVPTHVVHQRAASGTGIPIVLTHGWPGTFVEVLPLIPFLTDPAAHGIDGPAFDVVVPSMPGYAFSPRPDRVGITTRAVAARWHTLMQALGHPRYGAYGTDFGASVATYMALDDPERMLGIHLSNLDTDPDTGPDSRPLSDAERRFLDERARWDMAERGYSRIQSTKPQTLAYGLTDSPAGLAAWVLEKWRSWSDSGGDLFGSLSRDTLLTMLTITWATRSIGSSIRDYVDNRAHARPLGPADRVTVPTAVALFDHEFVPEGSPPREWAERLYDVRRWTPMPRGGHFAPTEEPELLARDIVAFFGGLRRDR